MHTASLHLEQGTGVPLSSLTPSAELSPPSQALVLDAARQPYNTWVSDSANAFCNPFAAHWVHFYSQCCFTVPNSQISSGSHSLPVMFAASWSLSALFARMRVAKGTDAQGAVVSLSRAQLFSVQVVRPWLHEQKTGSVYFQISSQHIYPRAGTSLELVRVHGAVRVNATPLCSPRICSGSQRIAGMEVRDGA